MMATTPPSFISLSTTTTTASKWNDNANMRQRTNNKYNGNVETAFNDDSVTLVTDQLLPSSKDKPYSPANTATKIKILGLFELTEAQVDIFCLSVLTGLAFLTRLIYLSRSNKVIWDEAHFGKFVSNYITRKFYFDVHPPLGKTLLGIAGMFAHYDGSFKFKSGEEYPSTVPFVMMRAFCAFWGALIVPLAYLTARQLKLSRWAALTAGTMVLFDNAYTVISRFILLDSMLLFFTVLSVFCLSKFMNLQNEPFSYDWWLWLFMTGVSLGCVSSVKWVGLFVIALVGLYTLESLWNMFGELKMPKSVYLAHWGARVLCLIIVPASIYMASFLLHFAILVKSGPGDAQMSSLFQANLQGTNIIKSPLVLHYNSKFTLKNVGYGGGLLHSHVQTFPHGSKQQQVTCYHHKDNNNDWIIRKTRESLASQPKILEGNLQPLEVVANGDVVRLVHEQTNRNLHSHAVAAPITKIMNEVSCYGNETVGDANDYWVVEIVDDIKRGKDPQMLKTIHALTTRIRLRHQVTGCLLRSHNVNLPPWGFKQAEVACDKRDDREMDVYNMWNVENHWNSRLPIADSAHYKTSFWNDFIHLNVAMWTSNNALVPDPDKEPDHLTSEPYEWPLMLVGIRMCSWGDEDVKFYMLGNPIVWWMSAASVAIYAGLWFVYQCMFQRQVFTPTWHSQSVHWKLFLFTGKWLLAGWVLHYLPFGIMGRVMYLHHYFPALYFTILLASFVLDHCISKLKNAYARQFLWVLILSAVVSVFLFFSEMTFGLDTPSAEWGKNRNWIKSWRIRG